jgi:DNA-binding transcriptional MerR regulator
MPGREWSIQEVARAAGTTSRTLRHYDALGLLEPSRIGANGYRYYDQAALLRLQRILLLRQLGLGLSAIGRVLDGEQDQVAALRGHLRHLQRERERIERQIESVRTTLRKVEGGEELVAAEVFDGFDHTRYEEEVVEKWGRDAYESGDRWWRSLSDEQKRAFQQEQDDIARAFGDAFAAGKSPDDADVQAIAARHHAWVRAGWQGREPDAAAFTGLGEMYVADPRFAAHYDAHGAGTAAFIRDAMKVYAERELS